MKVAEQLVKECFDELSMNGNFTYPFVLSLSKDSDSGANIRKMKKDFNKLNPWNDWND